MTDSTLDSALQAAEQTLLDQRVFAMSDKQTHALLEPFDRPEQDNQGLKDLFSRPAPWVK